MVIESLGHRSRRLPAWLRSSIRRPNRSESGQALVFFTVAFVVLLGFAAMVTDAGIAFWHRRMLQNAVDAAALAGAAHLPDDRDAAIAAASDYALNNGVSAAELAAGGGAVVITIYNTDDAIRVNALRDFDFGLRYIIGAGNTDIATTATALVAKLEAGNLAPWGVTANSECAIGVECILKTGTSVGEETDPNRGNFRAVNFTDEDPPCNASGSGEYEDTIENGYQGEVGDYPWQICTEPGNMAGATRDGLEILFGWDSAGVCDGGGTCDPDWWVDPPDGRNWNPEPPNTKVCVEDERCPRVVIIPLLDEDWDDIGGVDEVHVVDTACFYISDYQPRSGPVGQLDVYGFFLEQCDARGDSADYNTPLEGRPGMFLWR